MKCPLLKGEIKLEDADVTMDFIDCLKEECAWWDEDFGRCAVLAVAKELAYMNAGQTAILNKMPHEE